ncbi:antibiotic biosynthesis monooxygenase [Stutzerimonas urumqiensis]|uniref:putative quinol monooxygenase n=1 Tax=Stutzerimonas urumqiensis TaxID=638269 RepID=UPI003DA288BD
MYSILLKTRLKPGSREAFLSAMRTNVAASVRDEPGCLCFDVLLDRSDENLVWLYEVYVDEAALDAHMQTAHFLASRPQVEPLIVGQEVIEADVALLNPAR